MADIEQRARELLAAELRAANERRLAGMAEIPGGLDQIATHIALRAIAAALASQAQVPAAAVAEDVRRDAERYRWLKKNCVRQWESDMAHDRGAPSLDIEFDAPGHDLDSAVDAAMAAAPAPEVDRG